MQKMTPGRAVLALRSKRDISREKLADEIGVTGASIRLWEREKNLPGPIHLFRLKEVAELHLAIVGQEVVDAFEAAIGNEARP